MKKCHSCQKENTDEAQFCNHCGKLLSAEAWLPPPGASIPLNKSQRLFGIGFILGVCILFTIIVVITSENGSLDSEEGAKKALIGTWTYTNPDLKYSWMKLVINSDGTYEEYHAQPADNNWGTAKTGTWKVTTGKFEDTGRKYYAMNQDNFGAPLILYSLNSMKLGYADAFLTKGDRFPFSN